MSPSESQNNKIQNYVKYFFIVLIVVVVIASFMDMSGGAAVLFLVVAIPTILWIWSDVSKYFKKQDNNATTSQPNQENNETQLPVDPSKTDVNQQSN